MSKLVTELHIIGENGNMFDTDMEYIIPLYQRAYAWEDKQLTQLIEDIMYFVKSVFRVGAGAVLLDSSLIPSPPIMPQDRARVDDP